MKSNQQNFLKTGIAVLFALIFSNNLMAQNVVVSGALTGNGSYPDLNSAFTAINGGAQTAANISVNIIASTTETASAVLNAGAWTSLSVTPSGGALRTVTGALAVPLIDLNDADNVYINGLNTGGNSLTISNTNTGNVLTATIRFMNGATNNTVTNCSVLGSGTSLTLGTITFSTATVAGNSNNIISNCDIGPAGANQPVNGIFSLGTATFDNINNTVQNCRIFDYFNATLATRGILVSTNSSAWTISGNKFYLTALATYTAANTHGAIQVTAGNNYVVSNNIIGYSSSALTGNYAMTGTVATLFVGINLAVGTLTASSVQGNTLSAISLTTSSGVGTGSGIICGINVTGGNVNIGTSTGNLIGGTSGTNLIFGNPTTTGGMVVGINSSSTGTINILNNYIGGLTSTGTTAVLTGGVTGINISGVATGLSISTNTIGNPTTDNMRCGTNGLTTGSSNGSGINIVSTLTATNVLVSSNLIQNLSSYGAGTAGFVRGIWGSLTASAGIFSILNNTITNLTSDNQNATISTGQIGTAGIILATGTTCTVSGNVISNIANTSSATTNIIVGGISNANGTNTVIKFNKIYNITNTSPGTTITGPPVAAGIVIRSGTNGLLIYNNMISLGNGQTSNTSFMGIFGNHGSTPNPTVQAYYNTINIEGVVTSGALPSFGIGRTDFSATAKLAPYDLRNNLITNTRSGGTGAHYAIANNYGATPSNSGWPAGAADYNVLNANSATVGWWTSSLSFAAWKTASAGDANSYSGIPVTYVNSANDLHLNMGVTPTSIESGAQAIAGITTDIDNQVRPGPVGSVNGGALAPDIGADELDGVILDISPPAITYTNLPVTCSTGDRTLTALVTDFGGVPTTGLLVPRIYFKKNAGTYVSSPGVLASGTGTNGTWNFTLSASAMGGLSLNDVVSYFVIAGDIATTSNITSSPSLGLVASNVNVVTTPPTTPNSYLVSALNGTYTVGSAGNYTTITAAANAYNIGCLAGPVTFMLTDALYSTLETFPVVFLNNIYASATNSLLIRPAIAATPVITGTNTTILAFNGADYIKLDGSNNGTTSRNLTVENLTATLSTVMFVGNSSLTDAASNITINNAIITGSNGATTTGGIIIGSGITLGGPSDIPNNNITISGNSFIKTQNGIFAIGNATTPDQIWNITSNSFGSSTVANKLGYRGVAVQNAQQFTIISNTIAGVTNSVASTMVGILAGAAVYNGTISSNIILDIKNNNTTTAYGSNGITLSSSNTTANINVYNNMISDVASYGSAAAAITSNGYGMVITSGAGYKIYHNTILLNTNQTVTGWQAPLLITSGVTATGAIDLRNNIFANTQTFGTERYAIYSAATSTAIFSNIDYNNYSTTGPNLGFFTSSRATLAAMQTGFGGNLNSKTLTPVFVSATDLHLVPASNGALDDLGTALTSVTTDIDNQTRNLITPDMGADEFTGTGCTAVNPATISIASYTMCAAQTTIVSANLGSSGSGIAQRWKVSSTQGGPYIDVSSGTGFYSGNLNIVSPTSGTYYYVLTTSCTTASLTSVSNEATVTVLALPSTSIAATKTLACQGNTVILTASGATSYSWSTGATTSTIQSVPTASVAYTFTGTTATCTNSSTFNLLYSANPVITAVSASTYICPGGQATLSASGASTYTWTGGPSPINGTTVNPTPTVLTTYTVVGTNTSGCVSAAVTKSVNVDNFSVTITGNIAVCSGTIGLTASGATSYTWDSGATTSTFVDTPASNVVYTVTGTDALGCKASSTQSVAVGSISLSISGPSSVCSGKSVSLTALGGSTYTWSEGSMTTTIAPTPTATTTYTLIGIAGACTNTASKVITFNLNPTVTISGNATICVGQTTTLTAAGALTYSWSTTSTNTVINVSPTSNTTYSVTGTSSLGCSTTTNLAIVSNTLPVITIAASSTAVCLTSAATFTASGATSYTWNTTGPNTNTFSAVPTASTTYTVVGMNVQGCKASPTVAIITNTLPVLAVTPATAAVCFSTPIVFTASGASTFTWTGALQGTSVTYTPTSGSTPTVTGTSPQGCIASTTLGIVIISLPTITISPSAATVCAQQATSFTASGGSTYLWDGTQTGSTSAFVELSNITHTVVGTSALGCSNFTTVNVTVLALPVLITNPSFTTVCELSTANYSVSGASTYTWFNTSNATVTAITPTIAASFSVAGTGTNGCVSSALIVVLTNTLPVLSVSPGTPTICPNTTLNLTASGADTYTWSSGLGTNTAVIVTPSSAIVYTVSGTNLSTSCIGTVTVPVVTHSLPVIGVTPASATVCLNASANFTASSVNTYTWSSGSIGSIVVLTPTITGAGTYTVTGKDAAGCKGTNTVSLFVNPLPTIVVSPGSTYTLCSGETTSLTASGGVSYTWTPGNVVSDTYTHVATGNSVLNLDVIDANGCESTTLVTVTVNKCTGIKENELQAKFVSVYPNPSTGNFNLDVYEAASVVVYDLLGSVVYSGKMEAGIQTISLQDKSKGVYLMKISVGEKIQSLRLVID